MKADYSLDCIGMMCPIPVVKLSSKMKELKRGESLELLATDPGVEEDIPAWCISTKNEYLGFEKEKDVIRLYVKKR